MIKRATGEVVFRNGFQILPHCSVQSLLAKAEVASAVAVHKLSLKGWKRLVLGFHVSEHGTFEVEALLADEDPIQVVLLAHQHTFYECNTPDDADRRALHEGVISSDLGGQREFTWGEVVGRLEPVANRDWLVIAYSCDCKVPLQVKDVISRLCACEDLAEP
jgi:hypothetical protein